MTCALLSKICSESLFQRWKRCKLLKVTPEQATQLQIERYRQMTPGERIELALRLHELASEVARCGIRAQHPGATPEEVEELLRARRRLAYAR